MARPTGWDILGLDGDPTPGVVETVQGLAKQFGDFAHDVESAYNSLNSFGRDTTALDWVGRTAEAFKGQFGPLPGRLQKLYISYSEASDALSAYAPKLQAAQSKADSALRQAQDAEVDLQRATTTANNAASDLKTAQQNHTANPNPKAVSDAQTAHDTAQAGLKNAQARMDALKAQVHQAHDDLDTAAKDCAKALHHAQHDGIHNKHWWQHVGEFLSEWGGKIGEIAGEIAPVLDILAIATAWIPGVDVVTAGLAEADNMVALVTTGLQVAGDTMQGHYGDALMGAGMLGVTVVGGRAISKLGGKAFESLASKFGKEAEGAENAVGTNARKAEGTKPANKKDDPVDVVSGWMLTDATDLELPGVLPVVLRRAYASGYPTGHLFGPGWSSTLDQRLSINEAGIHFAGDDTQRLDYPLPSGGEEVLPERGSRWPLVWDREADEIRISDPWSGQVRHFPVVHFGNEFGQIRDLTAISDRNGNRINILRDDDGLPTMVEHPGYRVEIGTIATAAGPRVAALRLLGEQASGGDVAVKRFAYDERGRLTGVVNSSGLPFSYEWDENDRITAWQDRSGYRYGYVYDDLGRVVRGEGRFLAGSFAYDPDNRTTVHTNSLGHVTTFVYDEHGHVTSETDALGNTVVTETDPYGRFLSRIDALGSRIVYERDDAGDVRRVTAADGAVTEIDYNRFHQITDVTIPGGARWSRGYDDRGNLVRVTDPAGAVVEFQYSAAGALSAARDPLGAITRYAADATGLPAEVLDPLGGRARTVRDAAGRVVRAVDPLGAVTTLEWDVEGLPVSRTSPDGAVTRWEHDAGGRLVKTVSAVGAVTTYEPGPMDTLNARTGPDGVRHTFAYDSELQLLSVTNPAGASWRYDYDQAGRVIGEVDFNGRRLGYQYDGAGRLSTRVTGSGEQISLERDPVGRVLNRHTPEGDYHYSYDPTGLLASAVGPGTALAYQRDVLGRVLAETIDGRHTTRYSYDAAGRLRKRVTASGADSSWTFDAAGRPVSLEAQANRLEFSYDDAGREVQRLLGADTWLANQYDANGRPVLQQLLAHGAPGTSVPAAQPDSGAQAVLERSWIWRADGVPEEIRDSLRGTRRVVNDASGRPTTVTAEGWSESYAYDTFGNRTTGADDAASGASPSMPVSAAASGEAIEPRTLVRRSARTHHDYDSAGRLVRTVRRTLDGRRRTWSYSWDSQDRLVQADTSDNGTWRYVYDPMGRRTSKTRISADGTPAEQVFFTWDGPRLVEERLHRSDGVVTFVTWDYEPGTFRPAAQRRRSWAADADQAAVDEAFHAIITDLVGAPTELVTPEGAIAWHTSTDVWGRAIATSADGDVDCPLRFPGQYHDAETGLHYNLHRYYDPAAAAYLTPDPLGLAPAPNDHAYVPNPLVFSDPLGLAYEGNEGGSGPGARFEVGSDGTATDTVEGDPNIMDRNPLEGTRYTQKVLTQAASGDYHGFPEIADTMPTWRDTTIEAGGDGIPRMHVRLPGEYDGKQGDFHWIIEQDGSVNHRLFEPYSRK